MWLEIEKTIVMLDFNTFNLSKCNISCKKNFFKCRTKIVLFVYFWSVELEKATVVWYQHSQIFPNTKFHPKIKILKFGTKIALIGYFGLKFQELLTYMEFVNMQSFIQKQKNLCIFWLQFNKTTIKVLINSLEFVKL